MSKFDSFCFEPMGNKPVSELPGVGKVTADGLNCMGYYEAKDVYAKLRKFDFAEDRFCTWMSDMFRGCRPGDCYDALMEWHHRFGAENTRCEKSKRVQLAEVNTGKYDNFCSVPMDHKLVSDLPGVGEVTARKLNSMGYYKAKDVYEKLRKLGFDEDRFCSWMSDNFRGCRPGDCYDALMEWHDEFGDTVRGRTVPERRQDSPPTIEFSRPISHLNEMLFGELFGGLRNEGNFEQYEYVINPGTSERFVQSPRTFDQTFRTPTTFEQNSRTPIDTNLVSPLRTFEQLIQNPRTSQQSVPNRRISEQISNQTVQNPRIPEQSVQNPGTSAQSVQNSRTSEQPLQNSRVSEQSGQNTRTSEQSDQAPRTSEQRDPDPLAEFFQTMEVTVKNLPNLQRAVAAVVPTPDPIKAFFQNMQTKVKTLEPELILEVKSNILKIVSDYERRVLRAEPVASTSASVA